MNRKKVFFMVVLLMIGVSLLFSGLVMQESVKELFERGIYLQETRGDLEAAITIFQKIVKDFPKERETAARAQLQIGLCYEKLGLEGALKAYEDVISNYGEQKDVVAKARVLLSKLEQFDVKFKEPEGIRIKQIWKKPYLDFLGTISSDGQFLSCTDWGKGDLAIYNLLKGENRVLTHDATFESPQHFVIGSAISKNGKKIAYSWWGPNNDIDLYLVDVDNPSPRLLYDNKEGEMYPAAWLSDKELIVGRYLMRIGSIQIISINISDGTTRELKTIKRMGWLRLSCSPDEKYIAYDYENEANKGNGNSDINILAINGGSEISLVNHPANDQVLGWVPGRKEFLFISDRSGTWDLWAITVDAGKPTGLAKRIYTDIGDVSPVGYSENGDSYFGFSRRNFNASLVPLNSETGELDVTSGKSLLGSGYWMEWSPDGENLIHGERIINLKTGEERKYGESMSRKISPRWSPDGKSILIVGLEKNKSRNNGYNGGIYTVDVKTDQTTEILLLSDYKYNKPVDDAFPLSEIQWSLDGESFFYLFFKDRLVKHDLETGEDKILYKQAHFDRGSLTRSPDGKMLIFAARSPEEKKSRLFMMSVEGGEEKELCTPQEADDFYGVMWSPDGKYIYFAERHEGTNLWRIPAKGGNPQKVWHSEDRAEIFSIHPDGNQIALSIRERTTEIRVIENLVQELEKLDKVNK